MGRVAVLLLLCVASLVAQPETFEVVSIKPASFPSAAYFEGYSYAGTCTLARLELAGNRLFIRYATLCGLIKAAYEIQTYQVANLPGELAAKSQASFYEIQATADGALTPERARTMLRTVLAERFGLAFHREMEEHAVYALVVGKDGHKLSQSPIQCAGLRELPKARFRGDASCNPTTTTTNLAAMLTSETDRPVIDRTGLSGGFAFSLRWTPDEWPMQPDSPPTFFTAIQEQLGLKLEPLRAPVEVLVIERAERPADN